MAAAIERCWLQWQLLEPMWTMNCITLHLFVVHSNANRCWFWRVARAALSTISKSLSGGNSVARFASTHITPAHTSYNRNCGSPAPISGYRPDHLLVEFLGQFNRLLALNLQRLSSQKAVNLRWWIMHAVWRAAGGGQKKVWWWPWRRCFEGSAMVTPIVSPPALYSLF